MNEEEKKVIEFSFITRLTEKEADRLLDLLETFIIVCTDQEFVGGWVLQEEEQDGEEEKT